MKMKTSIKLSYDEFIADLTGNELELFHRVIGKLVRVDRHYVNSAYAYVKSAKSTASAEITLLPPDARIISPEEYAEADREEKRLDRVEYVHSILELDHQGDYEKRDTRAKELAQKLWHHGFITRERADSIAYIPESVEHGLVDFTDEKGLVRVTAMGAFEFSAA
jgi:hypothetical protein